MNRAQGSPVLLGTALVFVALAAPAQTAQTGRLDFLKSKDPSFALFVNTSATNEAGKQYPDELVLITGLPSNPTISARIDLFGPSNKPYCVSTCSGALRNAALSPDGDTALVSTDTHTFGIYPSALFLLRNIRAFARSKNPADLQISTFAEKDFLQLHSVSGLAFGPDGHWAVVNTDGPGPIDGTYRTAKGTIVVITGLPDNPVFSEPINVFTHSLGNIDLSLDGRTLLLNDTTDFSGIPFSSGGPKSDQIIVRGFRQGATPRISVVSTFSTPKEFPMTGPQPVQDARLTLDGRFILAPLDLIRDISAQQTLTGLNQIAILGPVRNGTVDTVRLLTEADGVAGGPFHAGVSPDGDSALVSDSLDNGGAKLLTGLSSGDPAQIRLNSLPFQFFGPSFPLGADGPPVLAPHSQVIFTSDGETALVANWITPPLSGTGLTPSLSVLEGFQSGNIRLAANLSDPTFNPVNQRQQIATQPAGLMDYINLYVPAGTLRDTLTKGINSAIDQADRQQDAFTPLRDFVLTVSSNSGPGKALKSSQASTLITLAIAGIQALYGRAEIVSGAGFGAGSVAPESIATIFGSDFAASQSSAAGSLPLPTAILTTQVSIVDSAGTSRLAPLFAVSPNQINFLIPKGTATGRALALIRRDGKVSMLIDFDVDPIAPGLFNAGSSADAAAVVQRVRADGSQSFEPISGPIDLGPETDQVYLLLFGTGIRANSGIPAVTAHVGLQQAMVTFAGPQGSLEGLDQVNVLLPRSIAGHGRMSVSLTVDGYESNKVVIEAR
jgi:uncharacterized protein (TIGR03437 family)